MDGQEGPPCSQKEVKGPRRRDAKNTGTRGVCGAELSSGNTTPLPARHSSEGGSLTTLSQVGFGETESATWAPRLAGLKPSPRASAVRVLSPLALSSKGADLTSKIIEDKNQRTQVYKGLVLFQPNLGQRQ